MAVDWYPVIDREICTSCLICFEFCQHEVYALEEEAPMVLKPDNCISRCHGCENQCPSGAITYFGDDGLKSEMRIISL